MRDSEELSAPQGVLKPVLMASAVGFALALLVFFIFLWSKPHRQGDGRHARAHAGAASHRNTPVTGPGGSPVGGSRESGGDGGPAAAAKDGEDGWWYRDKPAAKKKPPEGGGDQWWYREKGGEKAGGKSPVGDSRPDGAGPEN